MNSNDFGQLILEFGKLVGIEALEPEGDEAVVEVGGHRIHLSLTEFGGLALWTVLETPPDAVQAFREAAELNFVLAMSGDATIAFNRDTGAWLLIRTEARISNASWLERDLAGFLTTLRLVQGVRGGVPSQPSVDAPEDMSSSITFRI